MKKRNNKIININYVYLFITTNKKIFQQNVGIFFKHINHTTSKYKKFLYFRFIQIVWIFSIFWCHRKRKLLAIFGESNVLTRFARKIHVLTS